MAPLLHPVGELFEEQARRAPDAIALEAEGARLTYAQLDARAGALARTLRARGVGPDVLVGLCGARSMDLLVALLAIVKAGGAYVPLDLSYPVERLREMIADVAPALLIGSRAGFERMGSLAPGALAIDGCALTEAEPAEAADAPPAPGPENLVYVMFTSGSTGRPKAVAVPHRAVVRLVRGADFAEMDAAQTFLQLSPLSFDAATLEIWGPWLNGGRLVVMAPGTPSIADIGRTIRQYGVTTLWLTAGLFHLIVDERLEDLRPLRQLLAGGDVLSVPHVRRVRASLPDLRLVNGYGPTENTTFSACYTVPLVVEDCAIPIGKPIRGTTAHVLDEALQEVGFGVEGELFVGGAGLARGYLGRPDLTAERFIELPRLGRLYRTGDVVRARADGLLEFVGRRDGQVKVRGYRIELGEIEAHLLREPEVREAAVVARSLGGGDKQLVAYVTARYPATSGGLPEILRGRLSQRVPEYMMPSAVMVLPRMPLNANGKVNRDALPSPSASVNEAPPLQTDLERTIAAVFAEVLELSAVGAHDHFFEIGGTSLRIARLHERLQTVLQREFPLTLLFERPTVASLAEQLASHDGPGAGLSAQSKLRASLQRQAQVHARTLAQRGRKS